MRQRIYKIPDCNFEIGAIFKNKKKEKNIENK